MNNQEEHEMICRKKNIGSLKDTQENDLLTLVHYT